MDLDLTIFFQLGLLIALMVLLNNMLLGPLLRVMESRHQQIYGARREVERLAHLSAVDEAAYGERLGQVRRQSLLMRVQARRQGQQAARDVLVETRRRLAHAMLETRQQVERMEQTARRTLQKQVDPWARQWVKKLVGREIKP